MAGNAGIKHNNTKENEMAYIITPNTEFSQTTPNDADLFRDEFSRIYENFRFLKDEDFDFFGNMNVDGSLELEAGTSVNEFSVDGTLGGNSDDVVPTEKAVKTYIDNLDRADVKKTGDQTVAGIKTFSSIPVLPGSDPANTNQAVRKAYVDTRIAGHDTQHDDRFVKLTDYEDSDVLTKIKSVDGSGSGLDADLLDGAHKDTDGTLSGNSDSSVPTEKAVKNYVDTQIAGHDTQHDDRFVRNGDVAQTIQGTKTFSGIPVLPGANPSSANHAVRKGYVDAEIINSLRTIQNITGSYSIPTDSKIHTVVSTSLTANRTVTLPSASANTGRKLTVIKGESSGYYLEISAISGVSLRLMSMHDFVDVVSNGSVWKVTDFRSTYETGWINCNDWTNQHLGTSVGGNVVHNLSVPLYKIKNTLLISPIQPGRDNNCFTVSHTFPAGSGHAGGYELFAVDNNNYKIQTGSNSVGSMTDANGSWLAINNHSYSYKVITKRELV